jgi:hypothetical protein
VQTPDGKLVSPNECRQTNERVHMLARPGKYVIIVRCFQYFDDRAIPCAVAATGAFASSGILSFSRVKTARRKCAVGQTGHDCELNVSSGIAGSVKLGSRKFAYFTAPFPVLGHAEYFEVVVELRSPNAGLLQMELSVGQVPKFGGRMLAWKRAEGLETKFRLTNLSHGRIKAGENIYLSLFEATEMTRTIRLTSQVKVNYTLLGLPAPAELRSDDYFWVFVPELGLKSGCVACVAIGVLLGWIFHGQRVRNKRQAPEIWENVADVPANLPDVPYANVGDVGNTRP